LGCTSSPDGTARLTLGDLETAMRKRFVVGHACDELVAPGVTRADLRALFDAADTGGLRRLTSFDWQMRLYKLEFDSLARGTEDSLVQGTEDSLARGTEDERDVPPTTSGAGVECSLEHGIQAASNLEPEVGDVQNSSAENRVAEICATQYYPENTSKPHPATDIIGPASFEAQMDTPSKPAGTRQELGSAVKRRRTGKSKPLHANDGEGSTKDGCSNPGASSDKGDQGNPKSEKNMLLGAGTANLVAMMTTQEVRSNTAELLELKSKRESVQPSKPGTLTSRPKEMGSRVAVIGDGWGNGNGGYQAVVTEADDLTFTVVMVDSAGRWEETHVLKTCCILLEGQFNDFGAKQMESLTAAAADNGCKFTASATTRFRKS